MELRPYEQEQRSKLQAALAKPLHANDYEYGSLEENGETVHFDPWSDIIKCIAGHYAEESDELMIATLKAVRDSETFELVAERGFAAEFALYVLSGHDLTEYGTSPRGGWVPHHLTDLWQPLIEKWEAYASLSWQEA